MDMIKISTKDIKEYFAIEDIASKTILSDVVRFITEHKVEIDTEDFKGIENSWNNTHKTASNNIGWNILTWSIFNTLLEKYGERQAIIKYLEHISFRYAFWLKEITIPSEIKALPGRTFADSDVSTVRIEPGALRDINGKMFANTPLFNIYIPDTVKSMSPDVFDGCVSGLRVHSTNPVVRKVCKRLYIECEDN